MSAENVFQLISDQTGIDDLLYIERVYYECKQNQIETILKLLKVETPVTKPRTLFDDLRDICDAKDTIFQEFLAISKST